MLRRLHTGGLIGINLGLIVWSAYFVLLYALMSLGCRYALDAMQALGSNIITVALAAIVITTLAFIGYLTWLAYDTWRHADDNRARFRAAVAGLVDGISLVSTVWVGAPVFMVTPCY